MSKRHSNIFQWTAILNKLKESYITGTVYEIRLIKTLQQIIENIPIIMKITRLNLMLDFLMRGFNNI